MGEHVDSSRKAASRKPPLGSPGAVTIRAPRPRFHGRFPIRPLALAALALPLALLACERSTGPGDPTSGDASFDGSFDPDANSFVLQRITVTPPGSSPLRVDLVGTNLVVDPDQGRVSVDVAVRNAGDEDVFAPGTIWLEDFRPRSVHPVNADVHLPSTDAVTGGTFGYRYDDEFGDDRLNPGETSAPKTWIFEDPGAAPFSFAARAEFATAPRARLSGVVFIDENRNGVRDDGEAPLEGGWVAQITTPEGLVWEAEPRDGGRYVFSIESPGLYRVRLLVLIESPVYCLTTPNPLEVLLPPRPDGGVQSYGDANFGFVFGPCVEPLPRVILTNRDPDTIEPQDMYTLEELRVEGDVLVLRVGFSGCSADHPFALYAANEPLHPPAEGPGLPVLLPWMRLMHDDGGELCDAYFVRTIAFDLSPLREFQTAMTVDFFDWYGEPHPFFYQP